MGLTADRLMTRAVAETSGQNNRNKKNGFVQNI